MIHKVYVTKHFGFEAAHHLPYYDGKCRRLHGHSYKLDVTVSRVNDFGEDSLSLRFSDEAMVVDFSTLKRVVTEKIIDKCDHQNLNDFFAYPTAEHMVVEFYNTLAPIVREQLGCALESVKLWETEDSYAEYKGECSDEN